MSGFEDKNGRLIIGIDTARGPELAAFVAARLGLDGRLNLEELYLEHPFTTCVGDTGRSGFGRLEPPPIFTMEDYGPSEFYAEHPVINGQITLDDGRVFKEIITAPQPRNRHERRQMAKTGKVLRK